VQVKDYRRGWWSRGVLGATFSRMQTTPTQRPCLPPWKTTEDFTFIATRTYDNCSCFVLSTNLPLLCWSLRPRGASFCLIVIIMRLQSSVAAMTASLAVLVTTTQGFMSYGNKANIVSRPTPSFFGDRTAAARSGRSPNPLFSTTIEPETAKPGETFQFQAEVSRYVYHWWATSVHVHRAPCSAFG